MSKRKRETFNEFIVGLFMVAVIGLLAYFTIVISGVDVFGRGSRVTVRIAFDQVGGLKDHDNVMYRGTKVGKVERVEVTPTNLVVVATVDGNVVLRETGTISVCNLSMLGGNYLLLEEGSGAPLDLAGASLRGETPTDWMRDLSQIAAQVRELTEMKELKSIVTNVAAVTEKADRFMSDVEVIGGEAKAFITKANQVADKIDTTIEDAKGFLAKASSAAESIDTTATTINIAAQKADSVLEKLNDEKLFADLEAGVAAFRKSAESFDATEVMSKANELADNLNVFAEALANGEGSLGKLMTETKLYDELMGMIKDARQVLDNYRDTTPISTFSSLATGAL